MPPSPRAAPPSSITVGVVTDTSGGIIPGADVVVKNNATSSESRAVTTDQGAFTIPALNVGTYTVTVTLMGFKTVVLNNVRSTPACPRRSRPRSRSAACRRRWSSGSSEIIQTSRRGVDDASTPTRFSKLPLDQPQRARLRRQPARRQHAGRQPRLHGQRPAAERDQHHARRHEHPGQHLKTTDGFFARVSPRLDAIEEVTVTTAAQGADSAGQGAVQIRFVTRSGTQQLHRQRLLLPAARRAEREHLVQQPRPDARSGPARRRRPSCASISRARASAARS